MKDKISNFIAYNNINRPIEYPLLSGPFFSVLAFLAYLILLFSYSVRYPVERVVCIIGIVQSILSFILGMSIRKKYLYFFNIKPGKSLYMAEIWKYIFLGSVMYVFTLYISSGMGSYKSIVTVGVGTLFIVCVSIFITHIILKKQIKKGKYLKKKQINSKVIAFSVTGTFFLILMIIKNLLFKMSEVSGPFIFLFLSFSVVVTSTTMAVIYYLKLKYAERYGLEEYLPTRPNPGPYTGWK